MSKIKKKNSKYLRNFQKSRDDNGQYVFNCQHGPKECQVNIVEVNCFYYVGSVRKIIIHFESVNILFKQIKVDYTGANNNIYLFSNL